MYTLDYEISFKGDIDSTNWGYDFEKNKEKLNIDFVDWSDFNSDIDAINIYTRMKDKNDYSEKIISNYNEGIESLKTKPITEFLLNIGNGNISDGFNTVQRIIDSNSELSKHIQKDRSDDRIDMSKAAFMYYLISGYMKESEHK